MERFECEPDPSCKYYQAGCFEDLHHIFSRVDADSRLQRSFRNLPENKIVLCRRLHELVELAMGWPDYPSVNVMQAVVERER